MSSLRDMFKDEEEGETAEVKAPDTKASPVIKNNVPVTSEFKPLVEGVQNPFNLPVPTGLCIAKAQGKLTTEQFEAKYCNYYAGKTIAATSRGMANSRSQE